MSPVRREFTFAFFVGTKVLGKSFWQYLRACDMRAFSSGDEEEAGIQDVDLILSFLIRPISSLLPNCKK